MFPDIGVTPDPVEVMYNAVCRVLPDTDVDMVHKLQLPDGYNCHQDGMAIVVMGDVNQVDETVYSRDLVKVNVYGPDRDSVRRIGRELYTVLTRGLVGISLGVSRSKSMFFGDAPSFKPTGFVCTMSISVGFGRVFVQ